MAYGQVTLTQLQVLLAEKFDSAAFWTAEESRRALNEGLRVYNLLTGFWRANATLTLIPDDPFLSLPGSFTYRTRLSVAGTPLAPTSMFDMDNGRPNWRAETTSSGGTVPTSPKVWMPAGLTLVFIWPAVTSNTDCLVEGVTSTPILVNPGDFIDIGQEELGPLLNYALHVLTFKEGGVRFQATLPYYKDFLLACGEKNGRIKLSNLWRWVTGVDIGRSETPTQKRAVE